MSDSLKDSAIKGVIWSGIERFSVQGIQFILSLVIARQLLPSDYGMIAMLSIFMAIAQSFVDSGFSNALIQKQGRTDVDYSTVFYFNIGVAAVIYIIFYFISPYIASFYNLPELENIAIWVALNFVISAFSTVQRAKLTIDLDFRKQAIISLVSVILSGIVAVWMAYSGFGVWALVAQGLLNNGISTILLWISAKWLPSLVFSIQSFKELFSFGSKLLIGGLLHTLYTNMYSLVIGKAYSSSDLGHFNMAATITQTPSTSVTTILTRVTYPIECRMQDDNMRLENSFFQFIKLTAFVFFPMMIGLAAVADPLIKLVLTDKWVSSIPYLRIMCVAYMWNPIMRLSWDLLNAKHRSDLSLRSEIIKKIVAFAILFLSIPFGLKAMCIGLVLYSIADLLIVSYYIKQILPRITFVKIITNLFPILIQSFIMGILVYVVSNVFHNLWFQLVSGILSGIIIYMISSFIFTRNLLKTLYNIIMFRKN